MIPVRVVVRLDAVVVDDRVLLLDELAVLGDAPDADVAFPGATLFLVRTTSGVELRGHELHAGEPVRLDLGAVHVTIETLPARRRSLFSRLELPAMDPLVAIATFALALTVSSIDVAVRVARANPQVAALIQTVEVPERTAATSVRPGPGLPVAVEPTFRPPLREPQTVHFRVADAVEPD